MRQPSPNSRIAGVLLAAIWVATLCGIAPPAHAQKFGGTIGTGVSEVAGGALGVLGMSVVPNESASTLFIDSTSGDDYNYQATQFGGAFTVSDDFPLYMEGFIGASRYDPTFVFSGLTQERTIRAKWTSFAATGGLGWDIPLTDTLTLRPIGNFSLGAIVSDATIAQAIINDILGTEINFIDDGEMFAVGYGGSIMLDYEYYTPEYEIDSELRYSHIRLENIGYSRNYTVVKSDAITLGMWNRLRVPTGFHAFGGPIRGVGELAGSLLIGDQSVALQSDWLAQVGLGIEFDTAKIEWLPLLTRLRITARAITGDQMYGTSIGIGVTF